MNHLAAFAVVVLLSLGWSLAGAQQTSEQPVCSHDVQSLFAKALRHALVEAKDLPDFSLVHQSNSVYILDYLWGNDCIVNKNVLPASSEADYVLVSRNDLIDLASQLQTDIAYIRGGEANLSEERASISLGAAIELAPGEQRGLLCCCGGSIEFVRLNGLWEFRQWGPIYCA